MFVTKHQKVFLRGWHLTPVKLCIVLSAFNVKSFLWLFSLSCLVLCICFNHRLTWKKKNKSKRCKKKNSGKKSNIQNVLLFDHFKRVLCCHTTLRSFSPKLSSLIFTIFKTPTKKITNTIQLRFTKKNIEVQRNEPQQLLQRARDCPCCIFPLGLTSLRSI